MALFGSSDASLEVVIKLKDDFSNALNKIQGNLKSFEKSFESSVKASNKFAVGLGIVGAGLIGVGTAGVKTAAQLETARQGFITLLGSAEKADAVLSRIKKDAASTPFELTGLIQANQMLTAVTKDGDRSEGILLNVGKALAAAGKGGAELDRIILNLQQIGNTSKITEMDVRQFGYAGINILELLADYYGVTKDQAGDMVKNSKDAFADLEAAFAKAGEGSGKFSRAFVDQAGTFNQLLSNMKDNLTIFLSELVKQTGVFDLSKKALGSFVDFMNANSQNIINFINNFVGFLDKNRGILGAFAGVIIGALIPALVGLAFSLWAVLAPLAPFMAAGAIVGGILAITGGFQGLLDLIDEKTGLITLFQWAWEQIATTFMTTLYPALSQLWEFLKTFEPVLTLLAKIIGGVLLVGIYGVVMAITGWIQILTSLIAMGVEIYTLVMSKFVAPVLLFVDAVKKAIEYVGKLIARMSDVPGISIGTKVAKGVSKLLGFEHGGIVPGAIGEPVPILAHGQERIIPAGKSSDSGMGGGDIYQVTINNPTVRSTGDLAIMREQIEQALRDVTRGHKVSTI